MLSWLENNSLNYINNVLGKSFKFHSNLSISRTSKTINFLPSYYKDIINSWCKYYFCKYYSCSFYGAIHISKLLIRLFVTKALVVKKLTMLAIYLMKVGS